MCEQQASKHLKLLTNTLSDEDIFFDGELQVSAGSKEYFVKYFIGLNMVFSKVAPGIFLFEGGPIVGKSEFAGKYLEIKSEFVPKMK